MKFSNPVAGLVAAIASSSPVNAQSEYEALLCEAAEAGRVVEIVYDQDASKGCLPRLLDVHQVAVGNNGQLYVHGWQTRGCTKGRDYESERIFRFDKIRSVEMTEGEFGERSQAVKDGGWDGCIGSNCFIDKTICE
jgi:predicted DNA-binding transcriptional regulator YafY